MRFPTILKNSMIFGLAFFPSAFRMFTHQTRHLVSSFNMENDQRIKVHLLRWFPAILKKCMIFCLVFLASVFRLLTHQIRHLVWSFNMENDQHIKAHLLAWFPAIFENSQIFGFSILGSWPSIFQSKWDLEYAPSDFLPWGIVFWYSQSLESLLFMSF